MISELRTQPSLPPIRKEAPLQFPRFVFLVGHDDKRAPLISLIYTLNDDIWLGNLNDPYKHAILVLLGLDPADDIPLSHSIAPDLTVHQLVEDMIKLLSSHSLHRTELSYRAVSQLPEGLWNSFIFADAEPDDVLYFTEHHKLSDVVCIDCDGSGSPSSGSPHYPTIYFDGDVSKLRRDLRSL